MPKRKTHDSFVQEITRRNELNKNIEQISLLKDETYLSLNRSLKFRCSNGHIFETLPRYIVQKKSGCPVCGSRRAGESNLKTHDYFLQKLNKRNNECGNKVKIYLKQDQQYKGTYTPLVFICANNHQFTTTPKSVTSMKSGCPVCAPAVGQQLSHKLFLDQLQTRNNNFPDNQVFINNDEHYSGTTNALSFYCKNGHMWRTTPQIILKGCGCPQCNDAGKEALRNTQETFKDILNLRPLLTIISNHGDKIGLREPINVICEHSHTWTTHYERLTKGHYCPHCYGNAKYTDTSFKQKLEKITNSIIPLDEYINSHSRIRVQCTSCNHTWKPRPYLLLNGHGCPQCCRNNKFSKKSIYWLQYRMCVDNVEIKHAANSGEYRIPNTRYFSDGFCEQTNTVYEFYGDYWHGNPDVYNSNEYNTHVNKSYSYLYNQTLEREKKIKSLGYNIISIWENEYDELVADSLLQAVVSKIDVSQYQLLQYTPSLVKFENNIHVLYVINILTPPKTDYRNTQLQLLNSKKRTFIIFSDELNGNTNIVNSKIKHYVNMNVSTRIHARQCDIRQCTTNEKREFLNKYHVQGNNDSAQICYGAYYNNELIAVMTFSRPRVAVGNMRQTEEHTFELVRFTTNTKYRIPGIASKLLKHFQRNHEWNHIYSYADRRWSVGNLYEKLGFDLVKTNPPDYFYVVDGQRKHRWNYRKDILKNTLPNYDPNLTEYQNMQNHGFWRVWGCGTLKFSLHNQ